MECGTESKRWVSVRGAPAELHQRGAQRIEQRQQRRDGISDAQESSWQVVFNRQDLARERQDNQVRGDPVRIVFHGPTKLGISGRMFVLAVAKLEGQLARASLESHVVMVTGDVGELVAQQQ